ncbi:response regulator transcription factor [Streptomyces caniscabiei]|uniref:Response regulator transcription factor n=1 Tax=Streptomyces caniscabiei TaxID=2746961 RepID=A0A927LA13_9ACTN|nr:response regulator transcription factor [Streptomyces caniscabiei]MBD9725228.1 response regulator transcription factor [Streptomyces caniscabiei]MDX3510778.1 response regulator transcription factor [Streptomyces caniscabiei]MDX3720279.1 response regulator transcription factor [Streptomyces caniscabiei]MDX3729444.1 response regulator transcription factor [Streptomyces caniscabiei]WEO29379.1 response regulator transcription factor [Streptomyces caniscabiei]
MRTQLTGKPMARRDGAQRVLLVADDPGVTELLTTTMRLAGYRVAAADTGAEGTARIAQGGYDLVVWDAAVPDPERLGRTRHGAPVGRPPLLFLAACDTLHDLVPGLRPGDEDYVVKPLRVAEVLHRARALLHGRGGPERTEGVPCYGDLVLDDAACEARRGSRPLGLTPAEYRLLRHLLANAEHVLSKEQISRHVWGEYRAHGAIEKLVARLRRKTDREEPALIHTRRGFGYWLGCPDD